MTRDEIIDGLERHTVGRIKKERVFITVEELQQFIDSIKALEHKPKTGHWISIEERTDWYDATYECSCCGRQIITPYELSKNLYEQYPYCHCGAKMESEG